VATPLTGPSEGIFRGTVRSAPCRSTLTLRTLQAMSTRHAVALFAHARPDLLAQTLAPLREAGVPRIYAYVDGPRGAADAAGHASVLAMLHAVDWAKLILVVRPTNLGLHAALRAGLDDFFAREDAGIVLEEDNRLATGAYAWMCEALDRYAGDVRVGIVNGWAHRRFIPSDAIGPWWSMRWSGWGWGAWRRTWELTREPVAGLLDRLRREGFDPASYGADVVATAERGYWDSHLGLALYGARMLTLYPPRSLADHIGFGTSATNQRHAGQWQAVAAAPLDAPWPWPAEVAEHPLSRALWLRAVDAGRPRPASRALSRRVRRRAAVAWHRLSRAWRQWPEALLLRLTLAVYRARGGTPYDDGAPRVNTPMRLLWNQFLVRHRDAFYGRGLEVGNANITTALGNGQMSRCEVVDIAPGPGVDHVADLQQAWSLPEGAFDVFLIQFTVHLIAADRATLWHALRTVRAEGTLFVNFPCAGSAPPMGERYGAEHSWVWRHYTMPGVRALLDELGIDDAHVVLEPLGGAAAIAAYLLGVPVETMDRRTIEAVDDAAPLLIGARITKPVRWTPRWSPPAS